MNLSTKPYKGTRDFYPEDMRLHNWMFSVMRQACESYGYEEYDAPVLEPLDLYLSKTSEEVVNEQSYSFTDRGDRKVIMRPEMTPSVSRMVAGRRQELGYPLRLYSIANFFRYERPQKGRLREFWQLNADIFGVKGIEADIEIIMLADSIMKAFGANISMYRIEISSRKLLDELAQKTGIKYKDRFVRLVDSKNKIPNSDFLEQLIQLVPNKDSADLVNYVLNLKSLEGVRSGLNFNSIDKLKDVILTLDKQLIKGPKTNIVFNPATARGFDYYNDIVFEVFDNNPENNRSMFGGGRYDGLVANFGVEPVPTVGFGMGDVTLANFLESNGLVPDLKPTTNASILLIGDVYEQGLSIAEELRKAGINASLDYEDRKVDKKIKSADKLKIPYVLFVGDDEINSGVFTLKNLASGDEVKDSLANLTKIIKETR